jgi:ubiquinone/menaquinone biosynthesis C-methylase UbiE
MNRTHLELLASDDWRRRLRDVVLPFAFDHRSPADLGDDVLEVGPGPGLTTDLIVDQIGSLTAIEIDPELATALAGRYGTSDDVTVVEGDATDMPFEDARFSGATCFTMLHHVPEAVLQDRVFGEVYRVLRPGGLFVVSDGVARDELAALHVDDIYNPVDPGGVEDRLAAAGFVDIEVRSNDLAWAAHARRPG